MKYDEIPINPKIITWSRNRAGISLVEAKTSFRKIEEWEQGESFPTYPQLEKLSQSFKIPVAVFFFPEPPKTPDINESFRTLPESELESLPVNTFLRHSRHSCVEKTRRRPCYACVFPPCSDDCGCEKLFPNFPHSPLVSVQKQGVARLTHVREILPTTCGRLVIHK